MFWAWFISVLVVAFLLLALAVYASGADRPEADRDRDEGNDVSSDVHSSRQGKQKHAA